MATFKLQDENKDSSRQNFVHILQRLISEVSTIESSPIRLEPNDVVRQNFVDQRSINCLI